VRQKLVDAGAGEVGDEDAVRDVRSGVRREAEDVRLVERAGRLRIPSTAFRWEARNVDQISMTARMRVSSRAIALLGAIAVSAIAAAVAFGHSNAITTVAGSGVEGSDGDGGPAVYAELESPEDVAPLLDGAYLVADYEARVVRKVDKDGVITRVAGDGSGGSSGDGGPAVEASLTPASVSPTRDGGFLIAECVHHRIRKVHPDGRIETIAGDGDSDFSGDGGPATEASLNDPQDAIELADGSILIADTGNGRIRRIGTDGVITTVAGTGGGGVLTGLLALGAELDEPTDLTALPDGGYAFVDQGLAEVHRVDAAGNIERVAGSLLNIGLGDGGLAILAAFDHPTGVAALAGGGFLVADAGGHRVRRIAPDGTITTAAGTGSAGDAGDGGDAVDAQLSGPYDVGVTPRGGFYIADSGNHRVRHVDTNDLPAVGPGGVDVVPPPAPEITSFPASGAGAAPAWAFRLPEAGTTAWCRLRSAAGKVFDWAPCTSPVSYDLASHPDGEYTFDVKAKDAAGNSSAHASARYALERPSADTPLRPVTTTAPPERDMVPEPGRNQLPPGSPEPELGRSVSVVAATGVVRVRLPGGRGFVALEDAEALPVGTIFDTRHGEVALSTALDREGNTQTALFRGGKFAVRQSRRGRGRTHLHLRGGDFAACARPRGVAAAIAAAKKKKGKVRSLWGEDKNGRYSTHGRNSAATVRGTEWLTEDRCEGTRTVVRSGAVKVYDRAKRRTVLVRAGRSYLARPLR